MNAKTAEFLTRIRTFGQLDHTLLGGLRNDIEEVVPVGFKDHDKPVIIGNKFKTFWGEFDTLIKGAGAFENKARAQVGTLGGGNHFIEVCLDEDEKVWIMLHSGSRRIGKEVAERHIAIAKKLKHNIALPDKELSVFLAGTKEMKEYQNDLYWCQEYAKYNRETMMMLVREVFLKKFENVTFGQSISCHHNYVARETYEDQEFLVTRKGAIRAGVGELGIIPGSMGSKSFIVSGLGSNLAFNSASHGAGRKMSRGEAKTFFNENDIRIQTEGVECRKDSGILDELPAAYKDIDQVMQAQVDLVEVKHTLKQVLCVKG